MQPAGLISCSPEDLPDHGRWKEAGCERYDDGVMLVSLMPGVAGQT